MLRPPSLFVKLDLLVNIPFMIIIACMRINELKSEIDISDVMVMKFKQFWNQFKDAPLKGRNAILRGICPQIFGLFTVKLAVALTLIGGVQHVDASGTRVRGESHLLLVGDPGTGKSQFLKFAAKLSNRSVITTGLGSTSAGLTVTAVKDGGEWMLEAGALVLADGGLCCIDEFDSMREHDRATIHEAMEQQTISVAKAGLVTTLSTKTTVFGATNPKGHYDPDQPLSVNTTLSGPLLSRFDIVLVLLDTKNPEWDAVVSSHILSEAEPDRTSNDEDLANIWPLSTLKRYVHYLKEKFRPVLTREAEAVISSYYQLQRRSATDNAARTTVRMLESLIRLAQAHARLMFRNEVTRLDAITAILCIESSMTTSAIVDCIGNALHSNFTDNPDQEYAKQERLILEKLGCKDNFSDMNIMED
ncbi:variant 3, DNA helicase mcm9 [Lathyrus oleraceus]|uniref:Probable DNA helicase MCM9 n=1 Tax=Pisum sativum TaxID=3888 RepID=A0A9D5H1A5_PEA|nr:variant 3, DNA helicase mcm9 [Pisum sativum]